VFAVKYSLKIQSKCILQRYFAKIGQFLLKSVDKFAKVNKKALFFIKKICKLV
jgi:hypothetical protein